MIGDTVLLKVDTSRNQWPMTKVVQVHKDSEGAVRSVRKSLKFDSLTRRVKKKVHYHVILIIGIRYCW